ncbi:ERAP1-like C-terminal domain-containing protein, partial [Nocardioides sp.]|uniref:ERAP1-like C-terminal domain-containing protein n=1 Tax=Nocardioides sp. TaxID=35761 RepID=UPI00286E741B
ALVGGAAWDMTRDAEWGATDWVRLVLANIGSETDAWGVTRIPAMAATAVGRYSDPAARDALKAEWEQGMRQLMLDAEPGSDQQLTFARTYVGAARSDAALDELVAILDGSFVVEGLAVDQDIRWGLVASLARAGRFGDPEIDAELARDKTIEGQEKAAGARVSQPTVEAKAAGWDAILDPTTPNETSSQMVLSIFRAEQDEIVAPYVEKYLTAADTVIDTLGFHKASVVLEYGFPLAVGSPAVVARLDEWLADNNAPKGAQRYLAEARDDIVRALAAQARDAESA